MRSDLTFQIDDQVVWHLMMLKQELETTKQSTGTFTDGRLTIGMTPQSILVHLLEQFTRLATRAKVPTKGPSARINNSE